MLLISINCVNLCFDFEAAKIQSRNFANKQGCQYVKLCKKSRWPKLNILICMNWQIYPNNNIS